MWEPDYQCTYWLDGWPTWLGGLGNEWTHCCVAHDKSALDFQAGIELAQCVYQVGPIMGIIMGLGMLTIGVCYILFLKLRYSKK